VAALKRLKGIERRIKRDPTLKTQYAAFLDEYSSLAHVRRLELPIAEKPISFYLPHYLLQNSRANIENPMHLAAAVPAYR